MSSLRYSRSFRQVKKPENRLTSIESHTFLYDVHDLRAMAGKFDYLIEMGGVQGLATALRTDLKEGLYKDEATPTTEGGISYQRRTELYGTNVYEKPPMATFLELCLEALGDPMLIVLMIAGAISVGLGLWESLDHGWYEGMSIVIAVVLVTLVGAGNNYHQQAEFAKMDRDKEYDMVTVVRAGKVERIHPTDVLVGDIIQLAAGAFIPADGVLVADDAIKVNESRMTGESRDVEKNFYDPFLQAGTEVRQGQAVMIATAVGSQSAYGRIMASLAVEAEDTPLQEKLDLAAKYIGYFGAVVGLILFITLFIRWLVEDISKEKIPVQASHVVDNVVHNVTKTITQAGWHSPTKENWNKLISYLIIAVTIVVVAVPEGLPLAVTVSLAYSMGRMRKDNIMVHKLAACETMGNVTTICSDKTGTLTQNLMTVVRTFVGGVFYDNRPTKEQLTETMHDLFIESIAINSKAWVADADIDRSKPPESWPWKEGNQTEISLLSWISSYGIEVAKERQNRPVERAYPFDSIKKQSSVVLKASLGEESPLSYNGEYRQYFKGAAETIVDACTRTVDSNGTEIPLDGLVKKGVLESIDKMTRSGLRTVAFSYVDHASIDKDDEGNLKDPVERKDCVLVGVAGIKDPLRPETYGAVRKCQKAGIVVRMVTGDHLETAKFIARECGILTSPDHVAMLGEDFRKLVQAGQEAELEKILPRLRVLARSKPEDKEALVRWYKAHDHVVAVTGDGTNDAPALKAADVGLAMYIAGTAVAKAAAQIWILDDNFASIVKSVVWGRAVYDNIRKFVQFQLTINVVALLLSLIGAFTGYEKPLGAVQLLWVNLIMDTFAALALGTEVPTEALLNRRPYKSDAFLVSPVMMRNIIGMSLYQLGVLFFLLFGAETVFDIPDGEKSVQHFTLVFNAFVWMQFANEINSRKCNGEMNVFENLFTNPWFALIMMGSMGFQAIMVELVGSFAQTEGLTWQKWIGTLVIGLSPLAAGIFIRLIPMDPYRGQIDLDPATFEGAHLEDHRYSMGRVSAAHDRVALISGKEHEEVKAQFASIEKEEEKDIRAHKIVNEPESSILLEKRS